MASKPLLQVLIIGAGPIGLLLGSLLRDQGVAVTIVDKRTERTRARRVKLSGQVLLSDVIYDGIYLFSDDQIEERQQAINAVAPALATMIQTWLESFTPINEIQESLRTYFLNAHGDLHEGAQYDLSNNLDSLHDYPNTLVIDCTGYHSVLRNHIQPDNRIGRVVEYALLCTFILDNEYRCNELCKYYKNKNIFNYHVIPAIHDTYIQGDKQTFVTCIITIDERIYQSLTNVRNITYDYLKEHHQEIHRDLHRFLLNLTSADLRKVKLDTMEFVALPLHLYRSKKLTHSLDDQQLNQHWMLIGDAAMGGPYFQSISIGYEAAIYFAYIFQQMKHDVKGMLAKYEAYADKLWLKLQINSKEIEKNKRILQAMCREDRAAILSMIKIY